MEVRIDISKAFDSDLRILSSKEKSTVNIKINHLVDLLRAGSSTNKQLYRLHKIVL